MQYLHFLFFVFFFFFLDVLVVSSIRCSYVMLKTAKERKTLPRGPSSKLKRWDKMKEINVFQETRLKSKEALLPSPKPKLLLPPASSGRQRCFLPADVTLPECLLGADLCHPRTQAEAHSRIKLAE